MSERVSIGDCVYDDDQSMSIGLFKATNEEEELRLIWGGDSLDEEEETWDVWVRRGVSINSGAFG